MKWTLVFLAVAVLISSSPALAQLDPDPDSIGLYFDLEATVNCTDMPPGVVICYLMVTNISDPGGISAVATTFEIPPQIFFLGANCGGIIPIYPPDIFVIFTEPIPWAPIIHICEFTLFLPIMDPIYLYLRDSYYYGGDNLEDPIPLHPSTGYDEFGEPNPVAAINGDCPVPNKATTWGTTKTLYR